MTAPLTEHNLRSRLQQDGFAFVAAPDMRRLFGDLTAEPDWPAFAASWNDLGEDRYLAAQGRFRRRRHAVYAIDETNHTERLVDQPHYQPRQYNRLQGGIERWFEPVRTDIGSGPILSRILKFGADVFGKLVRTSRPWRVEVHQFRIEARADQPGQPTPEGMHRDGVDFVLVVLIARHNVASGTTSIHTPDGHQLGDFTLSSPLDTAWVVDRRVMHGVTPVHAVGPDESGHRDVLVVTYRRT